MFAYLLIVLSLVVIVAHMGYFGFNLIATPLANFAHELQALQPSTATLTIPVLPLYVAIVILILIIIIGTW